MELFTPGLEIKKSEETKQRLAFYPESELIETSDFIVESIDMALHRLREWPVVFLSREAGDR